MSKSSKRATKPSPEQLEKQEKKAFKRKIISTFTGMGFHYIPTNDREMQIGSRRIEIDALFIFENIWLICEDTVRRTNIRDHIRTKNEAAEQIRLNLAQFVKELIELFPDKTEIIQRCDCRRIKPFALYMSKFEVTLFDNDYALFSELMFVHPKTLNYFHWLSQCVFHSARNEVFRYLGLHNSDIGQVHSSRESAEFSAPIIYPRSFTGIKSNVRIVSFMMSAEDLLKTCYVLRKDNWEESIWLYQRLIDKNKIKHIRSFVELKGESFFNNIIVGLPDTVRFLDRDRNSRTIEEIEDMEGDYILTFPKEMNSVCVIDGQHRIFAHYESGIESEQEKAIAIHRNQLHLLVTGLVFPRSMSLEERARIQSGIFLDINSNAKPVPQNVLLQIKRIQNPIADESIAQFVIEKLNKHGVFQGLLQLSSLDEGKIKTASIVRFALRYLVTVNLSQDKQSLYSYWDGNKESLMALKSDAIEEYVDYCCHILNEYFGAIRKNYGDQWNDASSMLLSVISINGFIIALTRQLKINGVGDFGFYDRIFQNWEFSFSKNEFPYTSSQYRRFSTLILELAFSITPEDLLHI